ncbi:hypothetical protein K466DRAFT_26609 [Polyporus arcularius HHB13444]|uniref:Uncharacterized protein n=1 Tax=Polyporus arcularius HHB13444 TaxID=1314778 RepID=A0A5C3NNS8_9APHY|nr:hypothetical protein K466DRAFT_26609 [Polyporus arcularius HHB13444]
MRPLTSPVRVSVLQSCAGVFLTSRNHCQSVSGMSPRTAVTNGLPPTVCGLPVEEAGRTHNPGAARSRCGAACPVALRLAALAATAGRLSQSSRGGESSLYEREVRLDRCRCPVPLLIASRCAQRSSCLPTFAVVRRRGQAQAPRLTARPCSSFAPLRRVGHYPGGVQESSRVRRKEAYIRTRHISSLPGYVVTSPICGAPS